MLKNSMYTVCMNLRIHKRYTKSLDDLQYSGENGCLSIPAKRDFCKSVKIIHP